jgi:flagellar protein FlbB
MIGRSLVILLLIIILSVGGIFWFDYLNVIDAKDLLAPIYKYIPFIPGEGRTQSKIQPEEIPLNLDAERLAIRLEALDLRSMEMDMRQNEMDAKYGEIINMAQEIELRQKALEEWEITLKAMTADAENKDRNVEQFARYLTGMPPASAVGIIEMMDDQSAIDILRKTEEIAQSEGTRSIVAFWLSQMDSAKAAELERKMAGRPSSL